MTADITELRALLENAKPGPDDERWLIYKAGRGWYRPNAEGYTIYPAQAGRYSHATALRYSHPNGPDGPRDGMSIRHESDVLGAIPAPTLATENSVLKDEIQRLRAERDALREKLERCGKIVERNLGRQNEKVADVPMIVRGALKETTHDPRG